MEARKYYYSIVDFRSARNKRRCGYCGGEDTKYTHVELMLDHDGYKCGYCRQRDTAYSQGMWAHRLNAIDYQSLIDRGWRRSGHYCYKPTMNKTCCPQYTIRLRNEDFQFTKSKRKIINKMKQFLISGGEKEMKKWHDKYANNSQTSEINKHEPVTQQSLSTANEAEANSNEDLQMPKSIDLEFPKSSKTTLLLQPAQENNKDLQIPNAIDQTFPSSKTKSLPRPDMLTAYINAVKLGSPLLQNLNPQSSPVIRLDQEEIHAQLEIVLIGSLDPITDKKSPACLFLKLGLKFIERPINHFITLKQ